jgi:hypothetical protein
MAELQVLHAEPRHTVTDYVAERLGRRETTVRVMRSALIALATALCQQIETMKSEYPNLNLTRLRFAQVKWTPTGQLAVSFEYGDQAPDEARYFVDDVVHEIVERNVRLTPVQSEIAQFIASMVDQFSLIKKHNVHLNLDHIEFNDVRWLDGELVINVRYAGKPFGQREARW